MQSYWLHSYRKTYKSSWQLAGISAVLWRKGYQSQTPLVLSLWRAANETIVVEKDAISRDQIWDLFTVLNRLHSSVTDRIGVLVRQILAKRSIDRPVGHDEDLTECGLSSLDMVNLMLAVESEFDVKIPDRDMTPSNFRTIARIDTLVGALLQSA
jgi:acyl carrier protein